MAQRAKRSEPLAPAQTEAQRIKLEAGRRALAEWELANGPLTEEELAEGRARARASLGRPPLETAVRKT
ncbi:MAG: hypothetical protein JO244_07545, partial [Solirubrobacterales bacterium]|nr:hypothetical protein [Solirubrobacterales bacterium]